MRRNVQGLCLVIAALSLVGCGASRTPHTVIAPSYSYVQADPSAIERAANQTATAQSPSVALVDKKLPPIPAAPGFDVQTYVLVPTELVPPIAE